MNVNVIRYNYDTKVFSTVELRLFSRNDNDRPRNHRKWNVVGGENAVPRTKRNEFSQKRTKTWGEFKRWCQSNNLTPDEDSGGYGGGNNNNNGGGNGGGNNNDYYRTEAGGPTRNEGSRDLYTKQNPFKTDFEMGKMNARKYATVRLLKERFNEMLDDGLIQDIREDGNHNFICRVPKNNSLGYSSRNANYIYVGVYVIDDNLYGLVKWDMDGGGAVKDAVKNAAITGPDKLRQTIRKIVNNDKDVWTQLKSNVWNLAPNIIEYFGHLVTVTCKWAYGIFKNFWHNLGKGFRVDY